MSTGTGTVEQPSSVPTHKVSAFAAAGALTTLAVFIASQFDVNISDEAAAAITTLIGFAAGYFKRESAANVPPAAPAAGTTYTPSSRV